MQICGQFKIFKRYVLSDKQCIDPTVLGRCIFLAACAADSSVCVGGSTLLFWLRLAGHGAMPGPHVAGVWPRCDAVLTLRDIPGRDLEVITEITMWLLIEFVTFSASVASHLPWPCEVSAARLRATKAFAAHSRSRKSETTHSQIHAHAQDCALENRSRNKAQRKS